jgi:protein-tyrosine phosphatase
VLFVCLGNICRSPLAQGILDHILAKKGIENWITDSAGTGAWHVGQPPDSRTQKNAQEHGISLPYIARQVNKKDFNSFDYIFVMDDSNHHNLIRIAPQSYDAKILKMRDYDPLAKGADVPDPYIGGEKGFEEVYQMLDRSIKNFLLEKGID